MAEWRSQYCSTDNEYILFRIWVRETATNVIANTSTIRITVYAWRTNDYTTNYGGGCNVKIDGTARGYQYWNWGDKPVYYDSDTVLYDEENIVITHNSNGTKSINVQATCEWYADGSIYIDSPYQGFDITLTALDRAAPTVSVSTSSIGVNSFVLSASTNVNCDRWDYSINNGSTWTNFSTTNTTSVSTTISGLSPNTTYNTKVRARKTSNQVYGTSGTVSPKTLGNAILNSVSTVTADNSTVSFTINTTVYVASYTHKLEIKNGNTSILTRTGLTLSNGNNTITLTAAERTTLLNAMASIKSFTGTFVLTTWSGSTQIGSATSKTATVQTTSANSAPTFTGFTYQDNNSAVVSVTGNNQIMVQNASTVRVNITAATAKNSATIKSYSVSFGNLSTSSTSTTVTMGTITTSGTVTMTVTAIDSRGYSTSRSTNVTVVAYSKVIFTSSTIRRVNEVENTIQLSFAGNRKAITISGTEKNSITYCRYRYKKTSDSSWGSYTDILSQVTTSGLNFSFSNNALVNLDAEYSWNVQVLIQDKLTSDTLDLVVGQGIPLMSFRSKKVGINVLNPTRSLDVGGDGIKSQPGSGVTYISGCAGNGAGLYVPKDSLNSNHWIPGITVQTNGGGGWAMGNYNNEYLEFAYGTKANINSNTNSVSRFLLAAGDPGTAYEIITQKNLQDNMTNRNAGTATSSSYLLSKASDGASNLACIQNAFSSVNKSTGLAMRLQHGSHSMAFGWFLSGYDYAHAYGGFFISDYDTPRWIGVANGTWRADNFFTSHDTIPVGNGGTGSTTAAGARSNLGFVYTTLFSGALKTGQQTSVSGYNAYRFYLIVGNLNGNEPKSTVFLTSTCIGSYTMRYQFADESNYRSFQVWASGNTLYVKSDAGSNANGYIQFVIGII